MDNALLKKDRMRFVKNKLSSTLAYFAIIFNVLYYVSVYSSDPGNHYYTIKMGVSVIYNLLFLLTVFLSSEGLKNYKMSYAIIITVVGALQIVRIFGYPMEGAKTMLDSGEYVMETKQVVYTVVMLSLSAAAAIASGVIGILRTLTLEKYKATLPEDANKPH